LKTIFDECVEALHPNLTVWDIEKTNEYFGYLSSRINFESWGQISRKASDNILIETNDIAEIYAYFCELGLCHKMCYVITLSSDYPVLETDCQNILSNKDDILALSHGIYIVVPESNLLLEIWNDINFLLINI
jgi:hypothetical protein